MTDNPYVSAVDAELLEEQLDRIAAKQFYREHFREAGVDIDSVSILEDFTDLPFTTTGDLLADFQANPPRGTFFSSDVRQLNMTPAGDEWMPEYNTGYDLDRMAEEFGEQFRAMGIGPGDVALNCMGYTVFIAGLALHRGLQAAGATVVPVGAGDSEQAANLADELDVDVIAGFPSFGLKIAEQSDVTLNVYVGGGEPFTSVPGKRERVREAFGGADTVVDSFGLSEILPVAAECEHENGMHLSTGFVLAEVIDPDTEEPVPLGERGEVVLTHLDKEAMPLVRYRTGDLSQIVRRQCDCGRSLTMPDGVFGRIDNRLKVKGVKFYPDAVTTVLSQFSWATGDFLVEVDSDDSVDSLTITCEGDGTDSRLSKLQAAFERELPISPNDVRVVSNLEADTNIQDNRYS